MIMPSSMINIFVFILSSLLFVSESGPGVGREIEGRRRGRWGGGQTDGRKKYRFGVCNGIGGQFLSKYNW